MEKVLLKSENGTSTITFNRPDSYNALDFEMIEQLLNQLKEVESNTDKVLILTGKGNAFSAGGDVKMMHTLNKDSFSTMMDTITEIALTLYAMPKIVIAAINGPAAGLGLSIALAADYITANNQAKFGMLFAGIGLIPDGGGHFFLKERIGSQQAKQFIWSMEQVKVDEALKMGIADYVVDDNVMVSAERIAHKILNSPFKATIRTKLIYHESKKEELLHYLNAERKGQLEAAQTKDHEEGVRAFVEKRPPGFIGE